MRPALEIAVWGERPQPQGSITAFRTTRGRVNMVPDNRRLPQWRGDVVRATRDAMTRCGWRTLHGAACLSLTFCLPRPRYHYGTGRNADRLKPSAPPFPIVPPDADKLVRAVCDALTAARAWHDDKLLVHAELDKLWRPSDEAPAALITLWSALDPPEHAAEAVESAPSPPPG